MTPYEKLKTARASTRPTGSAYVNQIFKNIIELHGDRRYGDDAAIYSGIGYLDENTPATFIAIDKGTDLQTRLAKNFGCPKPEGYRKALRLMKQAEKFHRPVICFVDTLGAFCGADAEERGQGQAIAENILEMMGLATPIITIVIGEGGSGALALATADKVYMLENAVYSVISPEGCASILWKDSNKVADAAACLKITASDMREFKVIEGIITEDFDNFDKMCKSIIHQLKKDLKEFAGQPTSQLLDNRYHRIYHEAGKKNNRKY